MGNGLGKHIGFVGAEPAPRETSRAGVAPLAEQRRIVAEVDRRLSVIDELDATVNLNLKRAAGLRQSILKRAFEGTLVPQDPRDEPASVLLERIRADRAAKEVGEKPALKRTARRRKSVAGKTGRLFLDG
jgi:type I restriction enzyme, S subunit